jgi:hypothetical protein
LGLTKANAELVLDLQCRRPVTTATLDIDDTVIACDKRVIKRAYDGNRGYQPVLALRAEQDVIVADEFRDGNVPAGSATAGWSRRRSPRCPAASPRSNGRRASTRLRHRDPADGADHVSRLAQASAREVKPSAKCLL